jgi:sarcosine oxidase, subunit alpha
VGFYYKTAWGPRSFPRFERLIRRMSGLGTVDLASRPAPRLRRHLHCDVAVIGGGLSGIAAALAAAARGAARVILVDEGLQLGGMAAADSRLAEQRARLALEPRIRTLTGHCAVGCYSDHELVLSECSRSDGGAVLLRAGAVVLATGAIEQPAVFRNNDLPGVMLGSAALRLMRRHAVAPGQRCVVLGANSDAVALALELMAGGVKVLELAMLEGAVSGASEAKDHGAVVARDAQVLRDAGIELRTGIRSLEAHAGSGGTLSAVTLTDSRETRRIDCDALLMSVGWSPAQQLALQAGAQTHSQAAIAQHLPGEAPPGLFLAGRVNGVYDVDDKLADGEYAGRLAAAWCRRDAAPSLQRPPRTRTPQGHASPLFAHPAGKEFVDLDEDLTLADLANAAQEGFDSVELMKRYSTVGMGPSQGKLSNINAARHLAALRGGTPADVGLTTARPPYQPIALGAMAGQRHSPLRRTAMDAWHAAHGASWMPAGSWRRPACYARSGATDAECIAAEVRAVRTGVALIDVSTLGKIDVHGPDAALLLERLYTGRFAKLPVGQTRYALALDEAGTVIDDGVVARLADQHFYVSTTTTGAASIYREMQRRVLEWQLDCVLHNLTGHFAAMNLAGPRCGPVLAACTSLALDDAGFPFLAAREAQVAGVAARVLRVGFVGERGYEIHVPADHALEVWERLFEAGREAGIVPFGVEAQRVLRLEKGHVIVGQDTDGLTNPFEAGLDWIVKADKPFFVGQRSLEALRRRGNRQQLAGIEFDSADAPILECHLVIDGNDIAGRVTSLAHSEALGGRRIGLAFVKPSLAAVGMRLSVRGEDGRLHEARVVPTPFYDPGQLRQHEGAAA